MTLREVRTVEPLVDRAGLAELFDVSEDTIDAFRRAGMPSIVWGRRLRRFEPSRCLAWWREHEREAA